MHIPERREEEGTDQVKHIQTTAVALLQTLSEFSLDNLRECLCTVPNWEPVFSIIPMQVKAALGLR